MEQKREDARTTPPWLRLPGLLLLAALSAYYFTSYNSVYNKDPPQIVRNYPYTFWFGTWKMFTTRERYHVSMEAEAEIGQRWEPFVLSELFPYKWESGERYARGVFRRHGVRMRTLAQATCDRYETAHGVRPEGVRFYEVRWRKTLGETDQPRGADKREERKGILRWSCKQKYNLPEGVQL